MTETNAGKPRDGKERRGFASMDPKKQRELASKGGVAAHTPGRTSDGTREKKKGHEWTKEEAQDAGREGGRVSRGGRGRLIEQPFENGSGVSD